ncbi:putative ring finger protein [Schistosoma mansoni]|uniref:putative ring finger protein n=1 Tax=Schistosoma mansoni TaxID=6183 RepID=UPI00022DBEBA|nr:putative ring finger protein [Schistosoma mansoni]|eukprot:XP_018653972.1 putative ring finger protein [Schistosoma mansoni]
MRLHETQLIDTSNLIHVPLHSPFLECLAKQSANNISPTYPLNPLQPDQMELTDTILDQLIALSNVLSFKSKSQHGRFSQCQVTTYDTKSPELWNWNILTSLGRHLAVTRCTFSWESKSHMKFLKAVMEFLIPDQTCRTGVSDCKTEKCTNPISPPVVYSIPSKSMQSSDGLLPVDGLLNAISDNRNFMLQNFITLNTHDNIDRLLVHSREKNISESNATSTIMNNNSNTSRSNYLISPNANFNLAWLSYNWPHASAAGILAAGLITHLAHYPPASEPFQYLDRFLTALHLCLKFVLNKQSNKSLVSHNHDNSGNNKSMDQKLSQDNNSTHNDSNNTNMILTFHSNYLAKSCGGLILFAASRLTNSEVGELRLEKSDLYLDFQSILMFSSQLKKSSNSHTETHYNDTDDKRNEQCVFLNHAKIILSSLDYSHSTKLSRLLLTTAVNSGVKPLRMYTIRLIRLLFRLKLPFLASWCIDLVVKLCMDSSNKIRRLALCLLEELCWDPVNIQALSQNILHNQTNDDNNNIVCQKNLLTPFAIYLLHGNTGPIGHRIFGRVLSITTIFDKLCMNHNILRQPNSSFLHCDYGCCYTPQTNKNCPNSCLSRDELNISNNDNNKSVLSDPVNWMLDIARKHYNVAYAQEMDSRFTSLFVTYGTKILSGTSYKSTSFTYFDSPAINLQIPSPLNFNNNTDDEENSDRVDRPSNSEFNFEDNYFIEESDSMSGTYVSPSLVNDQSIGQVADGHDSFHCLPLPKHLYACIAEHRNGINLLDTRKDLETAIANMRSVLPQIINDKYEETNTFNDTNSLLKLKADMWALAHTCSTSYGQYWLLKHPELMTLFTSLALHSNSMNIRAVAWICLNLIATSSNQIFRQHNCLGMLQNDRTSKHINDLNCNESLSDWLFIPQIFYGRDVKTNEGAQDEMMVYPEIQSLSGQMVQTKLKPNRLLSDIFSVIPPVTNFGTETKNENLSLSAQKSVKSSVRNQVFENFNRSRRRLHRRWSPNHRRLSPPISESREHSSFHLPSHHFMSFVKPKHSINSFTQIASFSYDVSSVNISSKKPYSTWTHRDCIPQRQVISLNSPDNNKHSISFIDVAVHVQLMLSLYSNDKLSTLSSVPDEVSTDTTNYTAKNNINQLSSLQHSSCDKENRFFLSRRENRTSEKSSLIFDEIHSVSAQPSTPSVLSSNQNYFEHENHELSISASHSVEKLGEVDNWLVSSEVNETNLTKNDNVSHRLSVAKMSSEEYIIPIDVNQSPELSINDHHQLKNTNDHDGSNDNNNGWNNTENKANSSVHSNCLLPNTCLSYSCSLTNNDNSDSQCDQEMTEQDMWCNQLLDSISNLSSNVFSCSSSHDNNSNTLDEIIHKALITQKNFKGSIQLFNACTYTIIADLLGSYPFSRSIRTKIQSVFLYFELDELWSMQIIL